MRTRQPYHGITGIILSVLLTATTFGCASGRETETYSSVPAGRPTDTASGAQSSSTADAESGFAGVWQGTTLSICSGISHLPDRCNAEQKVIITLLPGPNGKFTGRYTCAYGNMDCYHANDTGKVIDVSFAGARMSIRVLMPDATSCIFTGIDMNQTINGGYTCYQGGSLIEQGSWRARRSY